MMKVIRGLVYDSDDINVDETLSVGELIKTLSKFSDRRVIVVWEGQVKTLTDECLAVDDKYLIIDAEEGWDTTRNL